MATIKFSEFDSGNINAVGAQVVGLEGSTNKIFNAGDLVNGLASTTYVDARDTNLQSQITQNANDIANIDIDVGNIEVDTSEIEANIAILQGNVTVIEGNIVVLESAVAALENNVTVNTDDINTIKGNIVAIENELANIADTDAQTLAYDGANANLSISNGNNVVLQEVLDNAGNITIIQGQIADLQANGNIQTLSLDNASNVLSISGGNTVDFTTVLGNSGGNPFDQDLNTTDSPTFDNLSTTGELDVNGTGTHTFEGTIQFTQLANFGGNVGITSILDEDTLVSDSATALATQQSIKAYVDAKPTSGVAIGAGLSIEPTAGTDGIAIGDNAQAGDSSVAIGLNSDASTNFTTAVGWRSTATGPGTVALGHECEATGSGSIAMGSDSTATASLAMAIGYKSDATAVYSTAIGSNNDISQFATHTISIGNYIATTSYTEPDAIKIAAGSAYETQVEVRPNYLDLSSTGFGIACNASVGFTFTDAINGAVTLSSLIGGGGGGSNSNIAVATASDGEEYLTTFDNSFFITADPTATDTAYIAMGEAISLDWNVGAYILHGFGIGKGMLNNKTVTNKIAHNGNHMAIAAANELYLGTRYAALFTDNSFDITLSSSASGHVALAIDNVDKLVVDGASDTIRMSADVIPTSNVTYDLGSATNRWKDLWLSGSTIHLGDQTISATDGGIDVNVDTLSGNANVVTLSSSLIPSTNAQYDLGSAEFKIRHLYLSDNSLFVGDLGISTTGNVMTTTGGTAHSLDVTSTEIDLTKTVHSLGDGAYTLADGIEGQIIYLVPVTGTGKNNVIVTVSNFRDWFAAAETCTVSTNYAWGPWAGSSLQPLITAVFTQGAWNSATPQ